MFITVAIRWDNTSFPLLMQGFNKVIVFFLPVISLLIVSKQDLS